MKQRMLMKARDRFKKGLQGNAVAVRCGSVRSGCASTFCFRHSAERQLHKERRANKHLLVESDSSDDDSGDDHSHHEGDGSSEASLSD